MKYINIYLVIINFWSFLLYGFDKYQAVHKKYRIKELTLLFISTIGGVLGCIVGMYTFHHKTLKFKFHLWNFVFLVIWCYVIICILMR